MPKLRCLAIGVFLIASLVNQNQLAAATYTLKPLTVINTTLPAPSQVFTESTFPSISLSVQDSAVQSGFLSADYTNQSGVYSGNYSSIISFTIGDLIKISDHSGSIGTFRANFIFDPQGGISTGAISFTSDQFQIDLAGSANMFQGTFSSPDNDNAGFVSGAFMTVPEPTSLLLLSGSMVCAVWLRQRRVRGHYMGGSI